MGLATARARPSRASYYFNGTIADVAVYPTALTAAQVQTHFAAALAQGG